MKKDNLALKVAGAVAALGLVVAMLGAVQGATAAIIPLPGSTTGSTPIPASDLVAWYKLTDVTSQTLLDSSGNGNNGWFPWDAPTTSGPTTGTCMNGITNYADLPSTLLSGLNSITVSIDVQNPSFVGSEDNTYSLYSLGRTSLTGLGPAGYLYATTAPYVHAGITLTDNTAEQVTGSNTATVPNSGWHEITYTYNSSNNAASLYLDGSLVATNPNQTIKPSTLATPLPFNTLGAGSNTADGEYTGCMKNFRIYNTALSADQVVTLLNASQANANTDAAGLSVQDLNDVRGDLYLPTNLADGAAVSWSSSNTQVIDPTGIVHRQAANTSVALTATVNLAGYTAQQQFTANVIAAPPPMAAFAGYLFAYFTDDSTAGQSIHLAVSNGNNILSYTPVNNGKPIFVSHFGSDGLRDPSIVRSPDGDTFYLIATDLDITQFDGNWPTAAAHGSQYIEVWESHNLVDWTQQAHTLISLPTAGNTWAPDAIWDPTINQYVVYWSAQNFPQSDPGHTSSQHNVIMYSTTRDFVNFSSPRVWDDPGQDRIDAAVATDGGNYYLFTKATNAPTFPNEAPCQQDILEEKATSLLTLNTPQSSGWALAESCIGRAAGSGGLEGPIVVKSNPGDVNNGGGPSAWYMFADQSTGVGYIPFESASISSPNWQKVTTPYQLPVPHVNGSVIETRHGGILPITLAEMNRLQPQYGPTTQGIPNYSKILQYNFAENGGTTIHDITGNGFNATAMGGATLAGGALTMDGSATDKQYALLPNNLMAGLTNVTIDSDVWVNPNQASPYMLYGLGYSDVTSGQGSGYVMATGDPYMRGAISAGNWSQEQSSNSYTSIPRGQWVRLTYVISHDWASGITSTQLYVNGAAAYLGYSQNPQATSISPGEINNGYSPDDYIGRSLYASDNYFNGKIKSFTIWNYALNASQVAALGAP